MTCNEYRKTFGCGRAQCQKLAPWLCHWSTEMLFRSDCSGCSPSACILCFPLWIMVSVCLLISFMKRGMLNKKIKDIVKLTHTHEIQSNLTWGDLRSSFLRAQCYCCVSMSLGVIASRPSRALEMLSLKFLVVPTVALSWSLEAELSLTLCARFTQNKW